MRRNHAITVAPLSAFRKKEGMTIVEVLIGSMLLVTVAAVCLAALIQGFRMAESSRDSTRVSQILQTEMENLRLMNWPAIQQLPMYPDTEVVDLTDLVPPAQINRYTCTRTITEVETGVVEVRLLVQWQTNHGRPVEREFFTYIVQDGINDYYYGVLPANSPAASLKHLAPPIN